MLNLFPRRRCGPIGLDIGARWVKLVQFSSDGSRLIDVARAEVSTADGEITVEALGRAIDRARQGRAFVGKKVVVCLSDRQLFLQNVRVPKTNPEELPRQVQQESIARIPFQAEEAELRFLEVADVRQLDTVLREVIVLACHRPVLQQMLDKIEQIGLQPVAVDVEPLALLRSGAAQYRRDEDRGSRALFAHVGYRRTLAVIAQDDDPLMIKVIDLGGKQFDEAVAAHLHMDLASAASLRRHHGDRRAELQDPEVTRSVSEAIRPVMDRLATELSLCMRYHSVTFRGQLLTRLVLGGGESSALLQESLNRQLDLKCELSDPFRALPTGPNSGRRGQWDIAAGLALRELAP
jgi:type IV pilus assembly protein PilM